MNEKNKSKPIKNKSADNQLNPMLLLVIVVVLCALATYIIPAGTYTRVYDAELDREIIEADSFIFIERSPTGFLDLFTSITLGLQRGSGIIFFLIIIGGMFGILNGTGALNIGIANMMRRIRGRERIMIPVFMLLFGSGAAFCGNFEEFLVFVPLILACCITAGFDSLVAVGIIFMAATAGYGGGITNTFTVGTAQQIAGLPRFSGMELRVALFIALEAASIIYLLVYATQLKKNPRLSGVYDIDVKYNQDKHLNLDNIPKLTTRHTLVLVIFLLGIIFAVYGIISKGYYVDELSAVFLLTGIIAGVAGGSSPSRICEDFIKGCKSMLAPGLMIGLANSAILLLDNANIMDTILYWLSNLLSSLPAFLTAFGMFVFHEIFNVIVPSGSAQAVITMPLMMPIADNAGLTHQTAVLAYQLGDAFTNILAPTGGEILAALAICRIPFGKWVRFLIPLFMVWWAIATVFIIIAANTGYGPF